ncbi:outer membrane protein assembly factor BamE [Rickettsiales bacterium]|nr:outer membrane protein assembly factor BamE [Rickettsiales bacterium]MDB2550561.1 outer membrane protein assembly factor BamE [Rickettsiales bacterium]
MTKLTAIFILFFLSSCLTKIENQGYIIDSANYKIIKEEITSKDEVLNIMGSPTAISFLGNDPIWIYFSQKKEKFLFFKPDIIERKIITIKFDKNQKFVAKMTHYNLEDKKDIKYISDYSKVDNPNKNIFSEFFGNIGRISAN